MLLTLMGDLNKTMVTLQMSLHKIYVSNITRAQFNKPSTVMESKNHKLKSLIK